MAADPQGAGDLPSAVELAEVAAGIARAAGDLITTQRPRTVHAANTKSSETDVVTEMDRRSEALIRQELARARPQDAVLGEEGDDLSGSSGLTWVVDPIDGTVNYLYDIDAYAVSMSSAPAMPATRARGSRWRASCSTLIPESCSGPHSAVARGWSGGTSRLVRCRCAARRVPRSR